jgi:hypothetical protein
MDGNRAAHQALISNLNNGASYCTPPAETTESKNIVVLNDKNDQIDSEANTAAVAKIYKSASKKTSGPPTGLFALIVGLFPAGTVELKIESSSPKYTTIINNPDSPIPKSVVANNSPIYVYKKAVSQADMQSIGLTTDTVDSMAQKGAQTFFFSDQAKSGNNLSSNPGHWVSLPATLVSGVFNGFYVSFGYAVEQSSL